jgi:hypothetical protein
MSHFTVMVIGDNPEDQLQPYHEYECTGIRDEYVKFVPAEEPMAKLEAEYEGYKEEYESFGDFLQEYHGYILENGLWGRVTNPNARWDWYVLGGRWRGFLVTKDGEQVDQALLKDIDFEAMRRADRDEAIERYTKLEKACSGSIPRLEKTWEQVRSEIEDINEAREYYHNQDSVKTFKAATSKLKIWADLEDYQITKEEYGQKAYDKAVMTFAVVKDSQWYEKGKMCWFACVADEKEADDWTAEFNKLLAGLPGDTLISVYDCHI